MLCHGGVVRSAVNTKNRFVDLLLGKGLPGVQRQILADGILRAGQGQRLPLHRRAPGGQVKGYAAAHHPVRRGTALPPQMCRHPRPQLCHPEWLGQKVICPDAQPFQHSGLVGAGTQKEDGHFGQAADAPTDRKAVLPGHHHVQQDAVCPAAERLGQISARLPRFYPVAVPLQGGADQLADLQIVIHCQNVCHKITSTRYKAGRMPHTAGTHGPGRTSRTAACDPCPAGRCTAASAAPPPPRTTRSCR